MGLLAAGWRPGQRRGSVCPSLLCPLALASVVALLATAPRAAGPVDPATFVGHRIGADFKLVKWPAIVAYFEQLARESPRLRLEEVGRTTLGNRMIAAIISSPGNLAASNTYRDIAKRLALARDLTEPQARDLAARGRAIVAITLNLHATEIASSQMALELAYHLATDQSAATRAILDGTIVLLVPSLNPDGQIMVCDWYDRQRGTAFEGGRLPWLYHPYAGHDNNRDWFMLNLVETRHVTRFLYQEWHPQALHDQHQMGTAGPRLFVPPYFDPINPNVHPIVWREIAAIGSDMALRLEEERYAGVVSSATYDGWRPGDMDTTPWWHNVPALITEAASVKIATPIELKAEDLRGGLRGLPAYAPQMNFPNPWPGGWWRLRDIVDYEYTAALGFLQACARLRAALLFNAYRMNRDAIEKGRGEAPYAFVIPSAGNDPWTVEKLLEPLIFAGVEVHRAEGPFTADGSPFPAGSDVVLMAQPLRPYAKDLLEAQEYPERRLYPGGPPEPPYDEAGWTLPLKMGVRTVTIREPFDARLEPVTAITLPPGELVGAAGAEAFAFSAESNAATIAVNRLLAAGAEVRWSDEPIPAPGVALPRHSLVVRAGADAMRQIVAGLPLSAYGLAGAPAGPGLTRPRVGLYQPWGGNPDEGWTRWVFERFEMPFETVHAEDLRRGNLGARFDVIVVPSMSTREIETGEYSAQAKAPTLPAPYAGGLGPEGVASVVAFVQDGGTLVALDAATDFAIGALDLPVRNVLKGVKPAEFFCPGSLLEVQVNRDHVLTSGMPDRASVFFLNSPAFELQPEPGGALPVALATYGPSPLRSGWILGGDLLDGRAAMVEAPAGRGRAILIGFRSQFRGQTYGTFRLLFNALYYATLARDRQSGFRIREQ